jgi:hypothetical protein
VTVRRGALARCVADPGAFLASGWGRQVLHARGADGAGYSDLLSLDDVDRLVASSGLRAPAFRLVKGGSPLPPSSYLRSARVGSRPVGDLADAGRVYAEFGDGATIVLQGLHRYWPPLAAFCRDLELALSHPVQANAYVTPPTSSGLRVHTDAHDVFALQTYGGKHWVVYGGGGAGDEPLLDVVLRPGDALYLPQGTRHAARTVDEPSVHITIGVRALTWADVLRRAAERAAGAPELAGRLPAGWAGEPAGLAEDLAGRLAAFAKHVEGLDAGSLAAAEHRRFASARTPELRGMLGDILALGALTDTTPVRRRPGAVCVLETELDRLRVTLGDRTLSMPVALGPAMGRIEALAPGAALRPADLAAELDLAGRLVLVRRLVREGLLTLASAGADPAG